jgi:hypothetical protein
MFSMNCKGILMMLFVGAFVLALSGCGGSEAAVVVDEPRPLTVEEFKSTDPFTCTMDDIEYFVKNKIAYHLDDQERAHIKIPNGNYIQKEDKTGWTFKKSLNKESSFYYNHIEPGFLGGTTGWGTPVVCGPAEQLPENFVKFLLSHPQVHSLYLDDESAQ